MLMIQGGKNNMNTAEFLRKISMVLFIAGGMAGWAALILWLRERVKTQWSRKSCPYVKKKKDVPIDEIPAESEIRNEECKKEKNEIRMIKEIIIVHNTDRKERERDESYKNI